MMSVSRMTGTPWHIETLGTGQGRTRHRSRCKHYISETKSCTLGSRCSGSAHCSFYEELPEKKTKKTVAGGKKNKNVKKSDPPKFPISKKYTLDGVKKEKCPYPIGCSVRSTLYGTGVIVDVDQNKVSVRFGGFVKKFSYPECLKQMHFDE